MKKLIKKPIIDNAIESLRASVIETFPDAIILNFFLGCFLSFSLSIESLIKYIDEDTMQNDKKDFNAANHMCDSKENEKSGAKKTMRFLVH